MRNILNIIIICCFATMSASAQIATSRYAYGQVDAAVNQPSVTTTPRYSSTIYEPFSSTTPSELSDVGSSSNPHHGHVRKGLIGGPEDEGPSPIGDALLPLLALALAFGAVTYFRRKRIAK